MVVLPPTITERFSHGLIVSWLFFHKIYPPNEIISWSHGEITITNKYFSIGKSNYYNKLSHRSKISWSHGLPSSNNHEEIFSWPHCVMVNCFQYIPPPHEIISWSHGEVAITNKYFSIGKYNYYYKLSHW